MKYQCGKCGKKGHNARTCGVSSKSSQSTSLRQKSSQQPTSTKVGTHNLQEIFNFLNQKYFNGRIVATLRWTNFHGKSRWGYYKERQKLIKINKILNQNWVPKEVVESVVFHEMCHQAYPPRIGPTGKREIHHAEFLSGEARYPNVSYWKEWRNKLQREQFNEQLGNSEDQLAENFKRYANQYGLKSSDLGRSYQRNRTVFTIIGFDPNRPKYPIRVRTNRGKVYITRVEDVKRGLGQEFRKKLRKRRI